MIEDKAEEIAVPISWKELKKKSGQIFCLVALAICTPIVISAFVAALALSAKFIVEPTFHLLYPEHNKEAWIVESLNWFIYRYPWTLALLDTILTSWEFLMLREKLKTIFFEGGGNE